MLREKIVCLSPAAFLVLPQEFAPGLPADGAQQLSCCESQYSRIAVLCLWKLQLLLGCHATSVILTETCLWENNVQRFKPEEQAELT